MTTRTSLDAPWTQAVNMETRTNSAREDVSPGLAADGLTLIFSSGRAGGHARHDPYYSRRPTLDAPWSVPIHLGPTVNSNYVELGHRRQALRHRADALRRRLLGQLGLLLGLGLGGGFSFRVGL